LDEKYADVVSLADTKAHLRTLADDLFVTQMRALAVSAAGASAARTA